MTEAHLNDFLISVEKRAFRIAQMAVKNESDALDIVQDAMIKWVSYYATKPFDAWKPLFYKVLETSLLDWHRKNAVRNRWFLQPKKMSPDTDDSPQSPETLGVDSLSDPFKTITAERVLEDLLEAIEALPFQQQQCFLLRCWEGLSINETASSLNISPGSVKTHTHRALKKLEKVVQNHETV